MVLPAASTPVGERWLQHHKGPQLFESVSGQMALANRRRVAGAQPALAATRPEASNPAPEAHRIVQPVGRRQQLLDPERGQRRRGALPNLLLLPRRSPTNRARRASATRWKPRAARRATRRGRRRQPVATILRWRGQNNARRADMAAPPDPLAPGYPAQSL